MQTHLICYADSNMTISQQLCLKSASEKGKIDVTVGVNNGFIDTEFQKRYERILSTQQRGGGYGFWLWKPYIVERYIRQMKDGDILIYCDSGVEWINDVKWLTTHMDQDIMLFSNEHRHIDWCKQEIWSHMLYTMPSSAAKQVQASVMLFKVNDYTREFCARWLAWCCIPGFVDDTRRGPQLPEFAEHRNDQSVLTNLQIADKLKLHWWPAQYGHQVCGQYPSDNYGQMFYHHRYRNADWRKYMDSKGGTYLLQELLRMFMNENKQL